MSEKVLVPVLLILLAAPAAATPDTCEIKVSGAVTLDEKGPGKSGSVGTDYWLSDAELRTALRTVVGIGKKFASDAERDKAVDEAMKKDPRLFLLLLNCETPGAYVMLGPVAGTTYKDMPMKPGTYPIGGGAPGKPKPGSASAMVRLKTDPAAGSLAFFTAPSGTLKITAWDHAHIAGTFEIDARKGDQKAAVKGAFDFPCRAGEGCKK